MRYALRARCEKKYLQQADEIIVYYNERERILDYPEEYPNAAVTIQCFSVMDEDIDWKWLAAMKPNFPKGFTIGVNSYEGVIAGKLWGLDTYLLKYINNFVELNQLVEAGVCYVFLDQPLFSSIDKIKRFNVPVRWIPNLTNPYGHLQRLTHGIWIRPEDIERYNINDKCIVEFVQTKNLYKGEQALFNIYANKKSWEQRLGNLVQDFENENWVNYFIDNELIQMRLNCGQKCEEYPGGAGCHACDRVLMLSDPTLLQQAKDLRAQSQT